MQHGLFGKLFYNNPNENVSTFQKNKNLYSPESITKIEGIKEDQLITTDKRILEQYRCLICQEFPFEPVECITSNDSEKSCGALCCKNCYEKYMKSSSTKICPLKCSNKKMKVKDAIHLREIFDLLVKIKCPNCNEISIYSEYSKHLQNCKKRIYKCNNENCNFKAELNEIKNHVEICPEAYVSCPYCQLFMKRKEIEHHKTYNCPNAPVTCPKCNLEMSLSEYNNYHESYNNTNVNCLQQQIKNLEVYKNKYLDEKIKNKILENEKINFQNELNKVSKNNAIIEKKYSEIKAKNKNIENQLYLFKNENDNLNNKIKLNSENMKKNYEYQYNSLLNKLKLYEQKLKEEKDKYLNLEMKFKDNVEKNSNNIHKSNEENEKIKRDNEILTKKIKEMKKEKKNLLLKIRNQELKEAEQAQINRIIKNDAINKNDNYISDFGEKIKEKVQKHYIIILMILIPIAIYMIYRRIFGEGD